MGMKEMNSRGGMKTSPSLSISLSFSHSFYFDSPTLTLSFCLSLTVSLFPSLFLTISPSLSLAHTRFWTSWKPNEPNADSNQTWQKTRKHRKLFSKYFLKNFTNAYSKNRLLLWLVNWLISHIMWSHQISYFIFVIVYKNHWLLLSFGFLITFGVAHRLLLYDQKVI